jgi:hypothetical protein
MKFKTIVILINAFMLIILASLLFPPLMFFFQLHFIPAILLKINIIGALFIIALTVAVNVLFFRSRRYFSLILSRNWPELRTFLTEEITERGHITASYVSYFIYTTLMLDEKAGFSAVEEAVTKNTEIFRKTAFMFAPFYLTAEGKTPGSALPWFESIDNAKNFTGKSLIEWCYAFVLTTNGRLTEAQHILTALCGDKDPLVGLLSCYLEDTLPKTQNSQTEQHKKALRKRFPARQRWNKVIAASSKNNITVYMLLPFINEALLWLYS